jgi:hypothetical protein
MLIVSETWIITNGIYDGVARLVGQTVKDRPIEARVEKEDLVVIGITSWGTVFNSKYLVNKVSLI